MKICLSLAQQHSLMIWAADRTSAEVDEDCEPSGYELAIRVCPPYPSTATVRAGSATLDLGEVEVTVDHATPVNGSQTATAQTNAEVELLRKFRSKSANTRRAVLVLMEDAE